MKHLFLYALCCGSILVFGSCDSAPGFGASDNAAVDAAQMIIDSLRTEAWTDSAAHAEIANAMFDTMNLADAPVKTSRAVLVKQDYSNYRSVSLTYKNISNKVIQGIKFRWYGIDAFGAPADMGNYTQQRFGGGFDDEALRPGRTTTSRWDILSARGKKIIKAWPIEVAFKNGTKW